MALELEGLRRQNFGNLENVSSRNERIQFRLNQMNDLSMLRTEWGKMCLKNSKGKVKIVKTKWHLNLGLNETAMQIC